MLKRRFVTKILVINSMRIYASLLILNNLLFRTQYILHVVEPSINKYISKMRHYNTAKLLLDFYHYAPFYNRNVTFSVSGEYQPHQFT